jgi:hypothetical protein
VISVGGAGLFFVLLVTSVLFPPPKRLTFYLLFVLLAFSLGSVLYCLTRSEESKTAARVNLIPAFLATIKSLDLVADISIKCAPLDTSSKNKVDMATLWVRPLRTMEIETLTKQLALDGWVRAKTVSRPKESKASQTRAIYFENGTFVLNVYKGNLLISGSIAC